MKNFLATVLLCSVITTAPAEPRTLNKPVTCDATVTVFKAIVEEFGETPQWQGSNATAGTRTVLTVNLKTGAWTLIEYTSATACVIGVGENASSTWGIPV